MYSGSTLTIHSGKILGAHQKIDRIARRHLTLLAPAATFPTIRRILHFEGGNGPDAIKRKSPAQDEPRHFFQPFDDQDTELLSYIRDHYQLLVKALRDGDDVRASFEAAWLAHAMVDGLTPAHHYPYEEKLKELRGGEAPENFVGVRGKVILPGNTRREAVANNWKMWGPRGLMTSHSSFEWGVATVILPHGFKVALPTKDDIDNFTAKDIATWYRELAQDVAKLDLYETFLQSGWTVKLGKRVRRELAPRIIHGVTLAWYGALSEAKKLQ